MLLIAAMGGSTGYIYVTTSCFNKAYWSYVYVTHPRVWHRVAKHRHLSSNGVAVCQTKFERGKARQIWFQVDLRVPIGFKYGTELTIYAQDLLYYPNSDLIAKRTRLTYYTPSSADWWMKGHDGN